jgi:hypothetical protein
LLQLLWGNDLLFNQKITQPLRHSSISYLSGRGVPLALLVGAQSRRFPGEMGCVFRVDTNCQRRRVLAKVTLVPELSEVSREWSRRETQGASDALFSNRFSFLAASGHGL